VQALKYRPDIDGLRAVAVVAVVLYHVGLPVLPGGFVGVDVFFVISGYLMAALIDRELVRGEFSFVAFYERRARRIFPALFAMLFFCTIVAAVIVPPRFFSDFGATLVATILFASNIAFWGKTANYFDAPTEFNPLLHTWSLAVEEQFYVIFPVFLWLAWRARPRGRFALTAAVAALSLLLCIWGTAWAPTATFYLLPTRAWELLLGALLALGARTSGSISKPATFRTQIGALAGSALVVASFFLVDGEKAFPGAWALLPTAGAALLIHYGHDARTVAWRVLAAAPIVFVGRISYSVYLWHWPFFVFVDKYRLLGEPSVAHRALVVALSFLAGYISWRWVEQPFRRRLIAATPRRLVGVSGLCMAVLGVAGLIVLSRQGWPERFPGIASVSIDKQLLAEREDPAWREFEAQNCFLDRAESWDGERCFLSRHAMSNALLWGDSFAASYARGFFRNEAAPFNVLQYTAPQCPPILGYRAASRPQCTPFNAAVIDVIKRHRVSTVILAANWVDYLRRNKMTAEDIQTTEKRLQDLGVRVILVGQSPVFAFSYPDEYFFQVFGARQGARDSYAPIEVDRDMNARMARMTEHSVFFDPLAPLCNGTQCLFKQGTLYLFSDYGHYTAYGSRIVVDHMLSAVGRAEVAEPRTQETR
jgi:peptidoglycan/LPS O-acetylase OafA/YrhL